jgi:hypothetical protein
LLALVVAGTLALLSWPAPELSAPAADVTVPALPPAGALSAKHAPRVNADPLLPPAAPPSRVVAPSETTAAAASGALRVRVVDGTDSSVVPNAALWVGAEGDPALPGDDDDALAPLRSRAPATADSRGEVHHVVAPAAPRFFVAAADAADTAAARRVGWRVLDKCKLVPDEPITLVIDTRAGLTLRVLDAAGTPVKGVPLRLGVPLGTALASVWNGVSTADGTARVPNALPALRARAERRLLNDVRFVAHIAAPLGKRPHVELLPLALPATPVELRLPPTGSLRVELDTAGVVGARRGEVTVHEVGLGPDQQRLLSNYSQQLRDNIALFPWVGLGLELEVSVHLAGTTEPRRVEVIGPVGAGEERRVLVPVRGKRSEILLRLLDPDGSKLPEEAFTLVVKARQRGSTMSSSSQLRSDADARVRISQADTMGDGATRTLELSHRERNLSLFLTVPSPWPAGETDLGDQRMQPPPIVVAGTVVGADGAPVAGADIEVLRSDLRGKSAADGTFTIRSAGALDATALRVRARARAFLPSEKHQVPRGTTDVRIQLAAAGVLQGEVQLDPLDAEAHLFVAAHGQAGTKAERTLIRGTTFELEHLTPDTYDVVVALAGVPAAVASARGVRVAAGQVTKLPPFDLRGALRKVAFTVVDENGSPLREAMALISNNVGSPTEFEFDGVQVHDGHGTVLATHAHLDLVVFATRKAAVIVPGVQDGQQIVLGKPAPVSIRVPAAVLAAANVRLHVVLEHHDPRFPAQGRYTFRRAGSVHSTMGSVPWADAQAAFVDGQGHALLHVAMAGEHRVRCWVMTKDTGDRHEIEGTEPTRVSVAADGSTSLEIRIPPDQIARANAALKR